jgi:hypothetical protein
VVRRLLELGFIAVGTTTNELFLVFSTVYNPSTKACDHPKAIAVISYTVLGKRT